MHRFILYLTINPHLGGCAAKKQIPISKIMEASIPIANAIRTALNPDGLNLFQSNEAAGFQTVFHFHLHLIPRWEGDPLRLP